jgi:hypothetical protein
MMLLTKLKNILILLLAIVFWDCNALSQTEGLTVSPQNADPILTAKMLEDAPYLKPEIDLERAIKIARANMKKKGYDLKLYFPKEARLDFFKKETVECCWYIKWVKWGVAQSANNPVQITVTMKGIASIIKE